MSEPIYDVVQVGYGPVSKAMAIFLSRRGHSVAVFERFQEVYPLPRAVCIDHEIARAMRANGLGSQLDAVTSPAPLYRWYNAEWKELLCIDWTQESISGGPEVNFIHQPSFERSLDLAVRESPNISLNMGWEAIDLMQSEDHVELTVRNVNTREVKRVRSRYLIGIDGANSLVRSRIGSGRKDLGFEADWLVIDMLLKDGVTVEQLGIPECGQYCNPVRPTTIVPGGIDNGRVCRRWEFMRLPEETKEEMETTEKVWALLGGWVQPDQADLVRHTVYTFRSLIADKWRDRRVVLAGDAAHVMPPFMGQGMCAGLRDAVNLSWKLDMVLKGLASDKLLDSYQPERAPHVSDIIGISIFLGQIICIPNIEESQKRDAMFLSGNAPPMAPFPILTDGLLARDASGAPKGPAGQLAPHAIVAGSKGEGRLDDIVGTGFNLILAPGAAVSPKLAAFLERLGGKIVSVAETPGAPDAIVDLHGKLSSFLKQANVSALLVRPDFYIYGTASANDGADGLVESLRTDLRLLGVKEKVLEAAAVAA
jgi:2-polyprenyl-6-methoxyphenol hydroxylase-like FAD-dependent oxidoreductase